MKGIYVIIKYTIYISYWNSKFDETNIPHWQLASSIPLFPNASLESSDPAALLDAWQNFSTTVLTGTKHATNICPRRYATVLK